MNIVEHLLARNGDPLTPQEAARLIGKNERTVRNWLNARRVPWGYKVGHRWIVDPAILAAWLETNK